MSTKTKLQMLTRAMHEVHAMTSNGASQREVLLYIEQSLRVHGYSASDALAALPEEVPEAEQAGEVWNESDPWPVNDCPDGYVPAGPWRFVNGTVGGNPSDGADSVTYWRRAIKPAPPAELTGTVEVSDG